MKLYLTAAILICLLFIFSTCSNEKPNSDGTILFPNKDSELTLLMRDMYGYYENLKVDIEKGELPEKIRTFNEIHSAVATEPSKSESTLFKAMSTVYLESEQRLNTSQANKVEVYNHIIDNCMNCHKQMCPGPMVKIKKLYVDAS